VIVEQTPVYVDEAIHVLETFENDDEARQEALKILKAGGS
jgi:hypothetical protein